MSRLPIRVRVTAAFAAAMALVLAGSGAFLYERTASHLEQALNRELELRSQDLGELVRQPGAKLASRSATPMVEHGDSYAQLLDPRGRVVDATRPLEATPLLTGDRLRAALTGRVFANRPRVPGLDEPSRFLAAPVRRARRRLVLVVGATRENRAETLATFRDELLVAGPIALVLACGAGYLLAGVSLRQVESMRRRAAEISADKPGERLPVPQTGDELEQLALTLNAMLDRLESALQRERDFIADAGHELRTPLALLRTELELALRHAESPDRLREAVQASVQEVDRLSQLADGLLLIARADRGKLALRVEKLDADEVMESVVRRFRWRADEERRELVTQGRPGIELQGDRLRIEQALGNLVDNALRYGSGVVTLDAFTNNGGVELHVRDRGLGFPPGFVDRAFERFTRPQRDTAGTGLGLSIVRAVAEAHGGSVSVANAPGGGADVSLHLPHG